MKLYHATKNDNLQSILFEGLVPSSETLSSYGYQRESDVRGVYGFAHIEDARNFALDNAWTDAAIVVFDAEAALEVVPDPEYDEGIAYIAVPTCGNIRAELAEVME